MLEAEGPENEGSPWATRGQRSTWEPQAEEEGNEGSKCTPDLGQLSCASHPPPTQMQFALSARGVPGDIQPFPTSGYLQS